MNWDQIKAQLPVLVILVPLIGAVYIALADVDELKKSVGHGALPVLELRMEQLAEEQKELKEILKEERTERQASHRKVDQLIDLLVKDKGK